MSEWSETSVLVTGGASGIGRAVVARTLGLGARVASIDLGPARELDVPQFRADVTDDAGVRSAVDQAATELGGLDVLVTSAGVGAQGSVEADTMEVWQRVYDVNVLGVVRCVRAALPYLRRSSHPSVVTVCSVAAEVGLPERAAYSATKGAVLALTRSLAVDYLADGIRVNCVNPGTTDTPWVGRLLSAADDPEAERRDLEARQPLGRLISADEVAGAVLYLASPTATATTGTAVAVDGGLLALRPRARRG